MPTEPVKHCPKCDHDKPLIAEFWLPRKESRDGYRGICRLCWYAQQRPNKRRHYQRNAERIRAERRSDRMRNPDRRRLADLRYYLKNRDRKLAYNHHYYWLNHERILQQKQSYNATVRPLRMDLGPDRPTDRIDLWQWQQYEDRQRAGAMAHAILTITMHGLTETERRFLSAFESGGYSLDAAALALRMPVAEATHIMERIRDVTARAKATALAA